MTLTLTINPDLLKIGEDEEYSLDWISIIPISFILTALDGLSTAEVQRLLKLVGESLLTARIECLPETPDRKR